MYNNYYPNYQQPMYNGAVPDALNQYKAPYQMQPKSPGDIIWAQGEAGAKAYLIAANNTVVLWDTETPTIYVKTADGAGVPSMRILDFKERNAPDPTQSAEKYVTLDQFNELQQKFDELVLKLDEPKKKKGDTNNG